MENGTDTFIGLVSALVCIYMFYGFHLLSNILNMIPTNRRVVCGRHTILVLCMTGTVAYNVIDSFVVISTKQNRSSYNIGVCIVTNIIVILEAFYQTLFIHKTKSVLQIADSIGEKRHQLTLRYVLLNVSLYSLTMWLNHTFFFIRIGTPVILGSIIWNIIRRIIFPFSTYFLFQSSFELFTLYEKSKSM